jgi:hypothetical protein
VRKIDPMEAVKRFSSLSASRKKGDWGYGNWYHDFCLWLVGLCPMRINLFDGIRKNPKRIASVRMETQKEMLTRREVLTKLRRVGVRKFSWLKSDCREIEQYMAAKYAYQIIKNKKPSNPKWINSRAG